MSLVVGGIPIVKGKPPPPFSMTQKWPFPISQTLSENVFLSLFVLGEVYIPHLHIGLEKHEKVKKLKSNGLKFNFI